MKIPFFDWMRPDTLSRLRRTPSAVERRPGFSVHSSHLLRLGGTVAGSFFHNKEVIHSICRVEDQRAATLYLRIVSEMGKVSLLGLRKGARGQIELGNLIFPFEVTHAALPSVQVVIFPQHAHPAHRQLLRVPASFLVRVRRQGSNGLWVSGQGLDISAGGCSFILTPSYVPKPGSPHDIDMLLTLPRNDEERPFLQAEVRWVKATNESIYVGIETSDPGQRRALTNATAKIQQSLLRHPEDYLLV